MPRKNIIPQNYRKAVFIAVFAVAGIVGLVITLAADTQVSFEAESAQNIEGAVVTFDNAASNGQYLRFGESSVDPRYTQHLNLIRSQTIRNKNHDSSPYRETPLNQLDISNSSPLLGPRTAYLGSPNGNPEQSFPTPAGGQNRTSCEFSHFAYDDPIVYPNQPGKAHLHMFFGNTDVNAYSTYETLTSSGSSTCNGQELNRTGYWAPAMIDGEGMVRIPERVVVYYKGEGQVRGKAKPYKPGMANISPNPTTVPEVPTFDGGDGSQVNFKCTNNFSGYQFADGVNEIPNCSGDFYQNTYGAPYPETRTVLEMEIKFWYCFPIGGDVTDWRQWAPSGKTRGSWFYGNCDGQGGQGAGAPPLNDKEHYPTLIYYVNYVVEPGDNTADWFLSSDVDPSTVGSGSPSLVGQRGSTHHADWWGGWHPDINQEWITNCVNYIAPGGAPSGCGFGYLSTGGSDGNNPVPGRALKYRPQYDTVGNASTYKVPLSTIYSQLCQPLGPFHQYTVPRSGAYCKP